MRRSTVLLSAILLPITSFAASGDVVNDEPAVPTEQTSTAIPEGKATIIIEQIAVGSVPGSWLLSMPDHTQRTGDAASETLIDVPSGNYVFYANLPNGTVSTIRIYKDDVLDRFLERSQTPLSVYPYDVIRIAVHYRLDKTGTISVQSDPPGTAFTLYGPDEASYSGVTPVAYEKLPVGQYKVQYESFASSCVKPAPKADQLTEKGRIAFNIIFDCDAANKARERQGKDSQKYLTISTDGMSVQLQDVQQKEWFSTYVFDAAKRGILSGYRDADGKPTGQFGPGNSVTVAELSKIAHRMAGIGEDAFTTTAPKNVGAANQWFSPFIASSENRGWIIYADASIDPVRPATRAEVMVTLMQAFDVPLAWQKGNVFHDVPVTHPYAAAIETAANAKVVGGRTDDEGAETGRFDPEASITRAEIAKVISTMLSTYKSPTTLRNAAAREAE